MTTVDTSRKSYAQLRKEGIVQAQKDEALEAISKFENRKTNPDYHDIINATSSLKENSASGRINDLKKAHLVEVKGKKRSPETGALCQVYGLTELGKKRLAVIEEQRKMAEKKAKEIAAEIEAESSLAAG